MRFLDPGQSAAWLADRGRQKPDEQPGLLRHRVVYPHKPYRMCPLALCTANELASRQPVLLWLTEWGIWPASENWHLYYRLRESYGERRLLEEAPGHLFLEHESEELATFLQIAMLNGWGGYVLAQADYANALFSHDEYIDFYAAEPAVIEAIRTGLAAFGPSAA
jgi:hypothetical protein